MIIVLKPEASESEVDHIIDRLRDLGLKSQISTGQERTIIGVIGDERYLTENSFILMPGVEKVIDILLDEFRMVMRQTRTLAIDQIDAKFVAEGKVPIMMRVNKNGFGL